MNPKPSAPPVSLYCHEGWEGMSGGEQRRLCERCQIHVHNLSGMSGVEREALLQVQGPLCVRYELAADGSMRVPRRGDGVRQAVRGGIWQVLLAVGSYIGERRRQRLARAERI